MYACLAITRQVLMVSVLLIAFAQAFAHAISLRYLVIASLVATCLLNESWGNVTLHIHPQAYQADAMADSFFHLQR